MVKDTSNNIDVSMRRVAGDRLVFYSKCADSAMWDQHWAAHMTPEYYRFALQGQMGDLQKPLIKYLPSEGKILEAGCGLGQNVLALRVLGYDVEGVEYAAETVNAVLSMYPDLPVKVGDVTCLTVPDDYYAAYISLGVIEHRESGPEPFLKEAMRVLAPGGKAFISVPWFNPLRRWKARLGWYKIDCVELPFYQYAFTEWEFKRILEEVGFEVVEFFGYGLAKGLREEVALLGRLTRVTWVGSLVNRYVSGAGRRIRKLSDTGGHMLLAVARRP